MAWGYDTCGYRLGKFESELVVFGMRKAYRDKFRFRRTIKTHRHTSSEDRTEIRQRQTGTEKECARTAWGHDTCEFRLGKFERVN